MYRLAILTVIFWTFVFGVANPAFSQSKNETDSDRIIDAVNVKIDGDIDLLIDKGFIRILTVRNPLFFSLNSFKQSGIIYDISVEFEKFLRNKFGKKAKNIKVILIPTPRDKLLRYLKEGKGEIAVANLTITKERQEYANFSMPTYPKIKEQLITTKALKDINSFDELGDTPVYLRESSSYYEHLRILNASRKEKKLKPIEHTKADENLEDYDLLEMMNAGIISAAIVDSHKAALWSKVFSEIHIHEDLFISENNNIAWAVRKNAPELLTVTNDFIKTIRKGSLLGNMLVKKYISSTKWIDNIRKQDAMARYDEVVNFIQNYAEEYNFDWLMIAAQGYQESGLDQSKKSHVGAVGVMQVMPNTAKDKNVNISNIHIAENNIQAGTKYLRFLRDHYYSGEELSPLDKVWFSFAAYNAGPGNVNRARKRAKKMGFDPNIWFGNVEVGMAASVSNEPVTYVRNILKYYISYKLLNEGLKDNR